MIRLFLIITETTQPKIKTYIISFELKSETKDYSWFYDYLRTFSSWGKLNETAYLVKSTREAWELRNHMLNMLGDNDRILVFQVEGSCAWFNLIAETDWIRCAFNLKPVNSIDL